MKIEEILQLVESVSKSGLTEFKYEEGAVKLSLKKTTGVMTVAAEPFATVGAVTATSVAQVEAPASEPAVVEPAVKELSAGNIMKSPLVGTFYAASTEGAEPFVKVGDSVKEGQILAIVEAMKLMNDIESDFSGTVVEVLVQNGETVEYGQPLFVIS